MSDLRSEGNVDSGLRVECPANRVLCCVDSSMGGRTCIYQVDPHDQASAVSTD